MLSTRRVGLLLVALTCAVAELPKRAVSQDGAGTLAAGAVKGGGGLLDFASYKKLFDKSYTGLLEETVRWKYFTASALQTIVSAIKYELGEQSHYSAINDMSDYSPEEFEMMENKALAGDWTDKEAKLTAPAATGETLPKFTPGDHENVQEGLRALVYKHSGNPVYARLSELLDTKTHEHRHKLRKRDTSDECASLLPRKLPIDELINTGQGADEPSPDVEAKMRHFVPSNNPKYQPIELATRGLKDTQKSVKWHSFESDNSAIAYTDGLLGELAVSQIRRKILPEMAQERTKAVAESMKEAASKPDEVFQDLRKTNCFMPVRSQGKCGSCYAFAGVAVLEYLYCTATGQLVPFSEQYIMDCGKANMNILYGCSGGNPVQLGLFVRNFGLHLRSMYPYTAKEGTCPYDSDTTEFEQTGYIRSDNFSNGLIVSIDFWPDVLKRGPLMICVFTNREFEHYRNGVFMGSIPARGSQQTCKHMVVLIGHGREGGREYWLIRNSWGTKWGDGGYGKIDKKSPFIVRKFGFMLGVKRPKRIAETKFVENETHDNSLLDEVASKKPYVKVHDKPAQEFEHL